MKINGNKHQHQHMIVRITVIHQRHTEITAQLLVLSSPLITKTSLTFVSSLLPNPKIPIHPINHHHE